MIRIVTISLLVLASAALADDYEQRSKLTGSWQIETTGAKEASSWILQPLPDGMHIAGSDGGKTVVAFDCKMAQECDIKDSGHHAKVTMYFNGPKLVENETIGSRVIRRRFTVTGDGNTMQLEVIPIEPEGKTETIVFKRVAAEAAKQ
jgi:hypothetical protein